MTHPTANDEMDSAIVIYLMHNNLCNFDHFLGSGISEIGFSQSWKTDCGEGGKATKDRPDFFPLLQLRVLCLGLLQDRNVRVGVFPQREEVLVGAAGLVLVACEYVGASKLQVG
jgi:hypothetical protein